MDNGTLTRGDGILSSRAEYNDDTDFGAASPDRKVLRLFYSSIGIAYTEGADIEPALSQTSMAPLVKCPRAQTRVSNCGKAPPTSKLYHLRNAVVQFIVDMYHLKAVTRQRTRSSCTARASHKPAISQGWHIYKSSAPAFSAFGRARLHALDARHSFNLQCHKAGELRGLPPKHAHFPTIRKTPVPPAIKVLLLNSCRAYSFHGPETSRPYQDGFPADDNPSCDIFSSIAFAATAVDLTLAPWAKISGSLMQPQSGGRRAFALAAWRRSLSEVHHELSRHRNLLRSS